MGKVDINDLGLASYNELIRLNFIENKPINSLSGDELEKISDKIFEKLGDTFLEEILQTDENGKISHIDFTFREPHAFKELILLFALCYVNHMDFNEYFYLDAKND